MKSKLILVIMMLLTFVGQATMAAAMPCPEMEAGQHDMTAQMHGHMMSSMAKMGMDSHGQSMSDCCDPECQCPLGGCLSASLVASPQINSLALLSESIRDRVCMAISQPPNSPYYPPIFASLA